MQSYSRVRSFWDVKSRSFPSVPTFIAGENGAEVGEATEVVEEAVEATEDGEEAVEATGVGAEVVEATEDGAEAVEATGVVEASQTIRS